MIAWPAIMCKIFGSVNLRKIKERLKRRDRL
jgi:hypothetical protein